MINYRMSESQKAKLEEASRPVESDIDKRFIICIRNDGMGINIIETSEKYTIDTPIHKDMLPILKEAIWIYEHHQGQIPMRKVKLVGK